MTFSLFPKKPFNEPLLELSDPRWKELEGGYRVPYDASIALRQLEKANDIQDTAIIYQELWNELHHQGDLGLASYYAVPHMVRIAQEKKLVDYNVLSLVSLIEIERYKNNNPALPKALTSSYQDALNNLLELVEIILNQNWNLETTSIALMAIAISKGQVKLANVLLNMDDESMIDECLENY
jgi:hypothetical protein